jgi:hypothetical protein
MGIRISTDPRAIWLDEDRAIEAHAWLIRQGMRPVHEWVYMHDYSRARTGFLVLKDKDAMMFKLAWGGAQ